MPDAPADALFPVSTPEHPDAAVAREEITRYYDERVVKAGEALAKAQAELARLVSERAAWTERGEITPDIVGGTDMAPGAIASASIGRWQQACKPLLAQMEAVGGRVVNRDPAGARRMRAEADRLAERDKALRRWLTAQGYDLGALAEPPSARPRRRAGNDV